MVAGILCLVAVIITARILWVFYGIGKSPGKHKKVRVLAIAGSGGHTTEILRLLDSLSGHYSPRFYVVANTDTMSKTLIKQLEDKTNSVDGKDYFIKIITRSREVAQPWLSSVWTTFIAILQSFSIVWCCSPDLILCTGPGTCIPLCIVGMLFKFLGVCGSRIVFVESICRVDTLSLTGKILYHWADKVFVQWPELQQKYPKSLYIGRIV